MAAAKKTVKKKPAKQLAKVVYVVSYSKYFGLFSYPLNGFNTEEEAFNQVEVLSEDAAIYERFKIDPIIVPV